MTDLPCLQHWIANRSHAGHGAQRSPVHDPASGRLRAEVALADAHDVDVAVSAAQAAFGAWAATPSPQRARADALAR